MKITKLLILILLTTSIYAQDYRFGKVSKEELTEKFYPKDSSANAAYLYRERRTYYRLNSDQNGFNVFTEVFARIKIYNKKGFEKATQNLPYYHPENGEDERISSLKAYTYNLEKGRIRKEKLGKDAIFNEKLNKFWSQKKITMPNIKEGSVFEYEYTIKSPYYHKVDDLDFQFDIPVKKLDYIVTIPEFFKFGMFAKGFYPIKPKTSKERGSITFNSKEVAYNRGSGAGVNFNQDKKEFSSDKYIFKSENIPALKDDEPFVANISSYRGGIKFELSKIDLVELGGGVNYYSANWESVSKQIFNLNGFGNELDKSNYYKNDLPAVLENTSGKFQKVVAIFQFVKSKVKWNGFYGKTSDNGVRKAYKEGVGNAADINLMLTSMLREAGLNANPVLISTRNNGKPLFPTLDGFNYVISMVEFPDNTYVLLDATEPYSLPNVLPVRDLNGNGRKVTKEGSSSWVRLSTNKPATEENFISLKIIDDFTIEGLARTNFENLSAINYRINNNHIKEESVISGLESKYNIEIENFRVLNDNNIGKPVTRMTKFTSEDLIESISNKLYIKPLIFLALSENPFKLKERKFPVDFGSPWKEMNNVSLEIPEGYKVESLPETMAIAMPNNFGVFKYQITQKGNKISAVSILEFNKSQVGFQFYPTLKKFYGDVVAKQSEKIVLVKIRKK